MKRASLFWLLVSLMALPSVLNFENMTCVAFVMAAVAVTFAGFYKYNIR